MMEKRNIKKKVTKRRNAKRDPVAKFLAESSKEVQALGGLALAPQTPLPLETEEDFRLTTQDQ